MRRCLLARIVVLTEKNSNAYEETKIASEAVKVESVEKKKTMKKRGHGAPIVQVTTTLDTSIQAETSHVTQATWTPGHTAPPASQPPLCPSHTHTYGPCGWYVKPVRNYPFIP